MVPATTNSHWNLPPGPASAPAPATTEPRGGQLPPWPGLAWRGSRSSPRSDHAPTPPWELPISPVPQHPWGLPIPQHTWVPPIPLILPPASFSPRQVTPLVCVAPALSPSLPIPSPPPSRCPPCPGPVPRRAAEKHPAHSQEPGACGSLSCGQSLALGSRIFSPSPQPAGPALTWPPCQRSARLPQGQQGASWHPRDRDTRSLFAVQAWGANGSHLPPYGIPGRLGSAENTSLIAPQACLLWS